MFLNSVRKFVSETVVWSLVGSVLLVIGSSLTVANAAHPALDATNALPNAGDVNYSLFIATEGASTNTAAVRHSATSVSATGIVARSTGLTAKSTATEGASQTATVRAGGVLSLYTEVSTTVAITADGGTFDAPSLLFATTTPTATTAPTTTGYLFPKTASTAIAILWNAPTASGTYTISMRTSIPTSNTITAATADGGSLGASIVVTVAAPSHGAATTGSNYPLLTTSPVNEDLFVAVENSTSGASIVSSNTDIVTAHSSARSIGLLVKDSTAKNAQSATVLSGGALSLYAHVSTDVAFVATGGTFSGAVSGRETPYYSNNVRSVIIDVSTGANSATSVAVRWTAPSTPGSYTISLNRSSDTYQISSSLGTAGTLTGQITVTVVAASAGGSYSAAYSLCNTRSAAQGHGVATGVDTTTAFVNNDTAYIAFDLDDGYDAALDSGAVIVSATNGALVSLAANASTAAAGTASTVVSTRVPSDQVVQVIQGTANAPVTTTVTITYNGTTVCTKTVTIRGEVASLTIGSVGTENLSGSSGSASWIGDGSGRAGSFTVTAKDSAGNTVAPGTAGVSGFSADSATLTTTVQAITISAANVATSVSSSVAAWNYSVGNFTCGATAGESKVKLKYTNAGTGTTVVSPEFTARCAGAPYTYTASFDKAAYVQGDIATLTVQFLDSKGNKANNVSSSGTVEVVMPMMTAVSATDSATNLPTKSDGTRTYTFTVGTNSGVTAGTYNGIVDFPSLTAVAAVKATPKYKISSGSEDVAFEEVLKSVVALIASINKQIQALQKLILQRKKR
jgi:hypothetical protein